MKKKTKKKTTKAKPKKTPRDKKIESHNDWITDKEYPMDFRNQFPT
nr:hypothetical protein [Pelagibacteraceae bacterium]